MTDKDLGRSLLNLDARTLAGAGDPRERTWQILARDRSRVWWLTALTVGLWGLALLMVLWMLVAFGLLFPLQAKLNDDTQLARAGLTPEMREAALFQAQVTFQMITVGVTCSVGILALAAGATLFLLLATRRATLRQINASLLEISEQLKALRRTAPPA